ncbi:MAG: hypothetical protein K2P70_01770 [Hyphomonadaceae bacterium]|nr:hypothetical protein [Hyphomonadaceae bacterium]
MSLTRYLEKHTPIRDAFKALHNAEARKIRPWAMLAPSLTKNPSFVGTAFDYLARISLASRLPEGVTIHSRPWVAETCVNALEWRCTKTQARKWKKLILGAREEIGAALRSDAPRAIELVQFLAHTDYLLRYPDGFDPDFKPSPEVTTELTALLRVFEVAKGFDAREICFLNPVFAASREVGGADADLILDTTLIDFKVVKNMEAAFDYVLQLAGYAVLHGRGGIAIDPPYQKPFSHVGIYYARHGQLATWRMSDIFQSAGFDKFGKMFWEELPHWKQSAGYGR